MKRTLAVSLLALLSFAAGARADDIKKPEPMPMDSALKARMKGSMAGIVTSVEIGGQSMILKAVMTDADGTVLMDHFGTPVMMGTDGKAMDSNAMRGQRWTVRWDDKTQVEGGAPDLRTLIHFKATEKDGKMWASWMHVMKMDALTGR